MVSFILQRVIRIQEDLEKFEALLTFRLAGNPADYDTVIEEIDFRLNTLKDFIDRQTRSPQTGLLKGENHPSRLEILSLIHKQEQLSHLLGEFRNVCLDKSNQKNYLQKNIAKCYRESKDLRVRIRRKSYLSCKQQAKIVPLSGNSHLYDLR